MEKEPSYYAVIPARVRYSKALTANAKLLYGEVTALCSDKGYCWASNRYLADLYDVSEKQVSLWVKQLVEANFIEMSLTKSKDGTLRKLYILEEKVIRALQKGKVANRGSTPPKGNTSITPINTKSRDFVISGYKTPAQLGMPDLGGYKDVRE